MQWFTNIVTTIYSHKFPKLLSFQDASSYKNKQYFFLWDAQGIPASPNLDPKSQALANTFLA